ncbi:hypothetical protein HPCPY6261_0139 [Helicobacter pylori CPY6261]|nr:hypothetical protein HPCPY6261_0139 [Helicobacter pylori CPY6261]
MGKKISNNKCAIFSLMPSFFKFSNEMSFCKFSCIFYDFNFLKLKKFFQIR